MEAANKTPRKNVTLLIASLISFLSAFSVSSLNVALPSIGKTFSMSAALLGWVSTAYLLTAAMTLVPFGKAADIVGRKRVFTWGVLVFTLSCLLAAVASSPLLLIGARFLQGLGAAMFISTVTAILTAAFPVEERGKALGTSVSATYLGLSLGPVMGGLLTQQFGWRSIFLVVAPVGLLVVALSAWKLGGEDEGTGEWTFDLVGSLIYGLSLAAVIYGLSLLPAVSGGWLLLGGVLGVLAFVWWELRVESPLVSLDLFRQNRLFALSNLTALLNYVGTFGATFLLSLYLQYIGGFEPQLAGLILVVRPAIMAVLSPFTGRLSDRVEPRVIASAGVALIVVALVLLTFLGAAPKLRIVIAALVLLGGGFALFSSPNANAIMSSVAEGRYGVASAMLGTMRLIGQTLSMGVTTLLLTLYIGDVEITPGYYPLFLASMKVTFAIFAALCLGGVLTSLARGKVR